MTTQDAQLAAIVLETAIQTFHSMKKLGDGALRQLDNSTLHAAPDPLSNSAAVIVKHMSGNMISRWTDFLTSDGEKLWRNRDDEFLADGITYAESFASWDKGWAVLFAALEALSGEDLLRTIVIRGESHTVLQAINRQISHYAYHVGQLVYVAKASKTEDWHTLSIARGQSQRYNDDKK